MPKALSPRPGGKARPKSAATPNLPRDVSEEVQRVTRPTEARDALLSSGMEGGMTEGYEKLDALLKSL